MHRHHEYAAGAGYVLPMEQHQQLLYQRRLLRPAANIKRIRQPPLPVYERSYSLDTEPTNVVPIYSKFVYPKQQRQHLPIYLDGSLSSLASDDYTDYDYDYSYSEEVPLDGAPFVVEPPQPPETAANVVRNLNALGRLLELVQRWPLPRLSFNTACICFLIVIFLAPRPCAQSLLFPAFRLFFGTLYPAYASYKAVRTKNVKEYVKWMMYWIVFAFFTCIETFTDIFLSWFPFYYEVKVIIVLWLLSPATKGSSTLYRKFVHPMLTRREQEIDEYLNQARERGYSAVLQLGSKGVNYATNVIMQTAIKTYQLTTNTKAWPEPSLRALQNSQSANELHASSRDLVDSEELYLPRSTSMNGIDTYADLLEYEEYPMEGLIIKEEDESDAGAARLRDLPSRKTRMRKGAATTTNKRGTRAASKSNLEVGTSSGIRGRRRLRDPTPDLDVDVDGDED
ncbi:receptor expression-enhancing protein 3 isoform X4 [Scaptodrosophila lebanonensis]|uniref:Receptor expression-enhancing protein 3 isoform X4 n=1 Tax=Drosophila lebanonensis TaxID=7225 RepID=A0A6J2TID7_DROLE|nr:receptor expression-enhancing protein 3 isoform X4 [Scaptodrosophila lebanonensis]